MSDSLRTQRNRLRTSSPLAQPNLSMRSRIFSSAAVSQARCLPLAPVSHCWCLRRPMCRFVGALVFPVGFAIIVILGLELLTSNFGIVPLAVLARRAMLNQLLSNWAWVFVGNFIGALIYAALLYITLTEAGHSAAGVLGDQIRALAEAKTLPYAQNGDAGLLTAFVKAVLCNWMVCLGAILGKLIDFDDGPASSAAGSRSFSFFTLGFEHSVVNLFVIPLGIALGARITVFGWWYWNETPVLIGNVVGGLAICGSSLRDLQARRRPRSRPTSRHTV